MAIMFPIVRLDENAQPKDESKVWGPPSDVCLLS